jgi:transposase
VIPLRRGHRRRCHDRDVYKLRNGIERFLNRNKECCRLATCFEKLVSNLTGVA